MDKNEEYRAQLLAKLGTLIKTLGVAVLKIEHAMEMPGSNVDRLIKVRDNLVNTLKICQRARKTLEGVGAPTPVVNQAPSGAREYTEMSSLDEYRKFQMLPPITQEDVQDVDWRDLLGKL